MIRGLQAAVANLREAGVSTLYLDGSFVEKRREPNDIDGCWDADRNVNFDSLDPVLREFSEGRRAMKSKFAVDFLVSGAIETGSGKPFVEFFQTDRDGKPRGLLRVNLRRGGGDGH